MLDRTPLSATCTVTLLLIAHATASSAELSRNGNCEQLADGKPVGWDTYNTMKEWGSLEDGHEGKGVHFIPRDFAPWQKGKNKGRMYTSRALCQGGGNGYTGPNALLHTPDPGVGQEGERGVVAVWCGGGAGRGHSLVRQASHCLRRTNLAHTIAAHRRAMRLPLPSSFPGGRNSSHAGEGITIGYDRTIRLGWS